MKKRKKIEDKKVFILGLLLFVILSCLTVGYAFSDKLLDIKGVVTVYKQGKLILENVEEVSATLPANSGDGLIIDDDGKLALDYRFTFSSRAEKTYYATYLITIFNDSHKDYTFTGFNLEPEINVTGASASDVGSTITYEYVDVEGSNLSLANNEIPAGERRYLAVKLTIYVASNKSGTTIDVSGGGDIYSSEDDTGQFYGYLDPANPNLDLKNNNFDCFSFKILNTYKTAKSFTISPGNNSFKFVNSSGNPLSSFTIGAPNEDNPESNVEEYEACVAAKDTAIFLEESETSSVILSSSDIPSFSIGSLNIAVNKAEEKDEEKVHIGDVAFSKIEWDSANNSLKVKASWKHLPDESNKSTSVTNYYMQLYDSNVSSTNPVYTFTVPGDAAIDNYTFDLNSSNYLNQTNMVNNNHNYFIKVYGVDAAGNSGLSDCSSGTSNDFCVASSSISLKYRFTITVSSTQNRVSFVNNSTTVYLNKSFQDELQVTANDYTLDSSVTVTMGSGTNQKTLVSGTDYTFGLNPGSNTRGTLVINTNVITDDVTVAASSTYSNTCLVEGTKIRLANGEEKNIEDIKYNDLIIAINHNTGKVVYEYPIWIEKKGVTDKYQIATFSDGSILKTVGTHGIFSVDSSEYVSVLDRKKFHVGTRVVKINSKNQKEIVKVTKIDTKYEKVNYYHVSSTYYHNVIANNLVTTDAMLVVSNMFKLNKDLIWTSERKKFLNKRDLFNYEDWKMVFPEHIFKGFRMAEAKILYNKGLLDINSFDVILNRKIVGPPKTKSGKYKWFVMTSDEFNKIKKVYNPLKYPKDNYYEANSYYTLPNPVKVKGKKFKGWYNTANDRYYKPGDKVEIIYSMYFDAIWE